MLLALAMCTTLQSAPQPGKKYSAQEWSYLEGYAPLNITQSVAKAWADICGRNKTLYADLNKIKPGDTILLPLGCGPYVAQAGGQDCMWRAAEWYVDHVVMPYYGRPVPGSAPDSPTNPRSTQGDAPQTYVFEYSDPYKVGFGVIVIALLIAIALYLWWRHRRSSRNFVVNPPDFQSAHDEVVHATAESALQRTLGRTIKIIGRVIRGFATGPMEMVNKDGSTEIVEFRNEQAFLATVEFPDGQRRQVVCKWGCFNLLMHRKDAQFHGTFVPLGAKNTAVVIPDYSDEQISAIRRNVSTGGDLTADDLPAAEMSTDTPTTTTVAPTAAPSLDPTNQPMEIGEIQTSKERITVKGFQGTPGQLREVFQVLKDFGHPNDGDDKPATTETPASATTSDEGKTS